MPSLRFGLALLSVAGACSDASPPASGTGTTAASGASGASGGSAGTSEAQNGSTAGVPHPLGCTASDACPEGQRCIGGYDPGLATMTQGRCLDACTPRGDLTRWCFDDAGCCEGLRCNTVDGFCAPPPEDGGSSSGSTSGDGPSRETSGTSSVAEPDTTTGSGTTSA